MHLPNIYSAAVRKYYAIGLNDWTVTYECGDKTVATVWASARLVLPDGETEAPHCESCLKSIQANTFEACNVRVQVAKKGWGSLHHESNQEFTELNPEM